MYSIQVEVRKTPLQISMNDLGKQLSMFSFGVIGVIVLIGIIQKRSWLDMFTIGGWYKISKGNKLIGIEKSL